VVNPELSIFLRDDSGLFRRRLAAGGRPWRANSGALHPQIRSGVDRLDLIDRDDGSGPDESRWTPVADVRTRRRSRALLAHPPHRVAPVGHGR
jgi:hypothetical protein